MIGNLAPRSEQAENKAVEQTDRRRRRTSTRLVFAHHMDRFVAGDCAPGSAERAKMLACAHPALDRPELLLSEGFAKDIVNSSTDAPYKDEYCCAVVVSGQLIKS